MSEETKQLEAGRDLDEAVFLKLGWTYEPRFEGDTTGYLRYGPGVLQVVIYEEWPSPSTNWEDTGKLIETMMQKWRYEVSIVPLDVIGVRLIHPTRTGKDVWVEGKTAPHAICLAFLKLELE
jgi:hypothetical protein